MFTKALPLAALALAACGTNTDVGDKPADARPATPQVLEQEKPQTGLPVSVADTNVTEISRAVGPTLTIVIENLRTLQGQLCYSLFDKAHADRFAKSDATAADIVKADCVPVTAGTLSIAVPGLAEGSYALAVYHDVDKNGKLNTLGGALAIPTEDFGFSNNPPLMPRSPTFAECEFSLPAAGGTQQITLRKIL